MHLEHAFLFIKSIKVAIKHLAKLIFWNPTLCICRFVQTENITLQNMHISITNDLNKRFVFI